MQWNRRWLRSVGIALLASTALACGSTPEPTRWDDAAGEIDEGKVDKPIGSIVAGSAFNALLPADGFKDHARVFTQEREGYAEADYKLDGETVVTVSISDTRNNPSARNKFSDAKEELGGYPLVERGSNSSMVLVNDRFQVRASSRSLGASERKEWLGAASLDQLAGLN